MLIIIGLMLIIIVNEITLLRVNIKLDNLEKGDKDAIQKRSNRKQ